MATVADILSILKDKLLPYELAYASRGASDAALIRAIDGGKAMVWQTAVAASHKSNGHWFSKQASVSFSSSNSAALPADFHSLLTAEATTVVMRPSGFHKQAWRDGRAKSASVDPANLSDIYFVVGGHTDGTPRLLLSRVASSLSVTVQYTHKLPVWTASGDNVDLVPDVFHEAIANYAASSLLGAAQDPQISKLWHEIWKDSQALVAEVCMSRQFGGVVSEEDYH